MLPKGAKNCSVTFYLTNKEIKQNRMYIVRMLKRSLIDNLYEILFDCFNVTHRNYIQPYLCWKKIYYRQPNNQSATIKSMSNT